MIRWIVLVAGLLGASGVIVGSFAAHGLQEYLAKQSVAQVDIAKRVAQCEVGVRYQLWHAIALLVLGLAREGLAPKRRMAGAACLIIGVVLFSGGLYSMSILGIVGHWAIVPSGGAALILGWLLVTSIALTNRQS